LSAASECEICILADERRIDSMDDNDTEQIQRIVEVISPQLSVTNVFLDSVVTWWAAAYLHDVFKVWSEIFARLL
jgi:hypothetical protein